MFEMFKKQNDEVLLERIPIINQKQKNRLTKLQNRKKKIPQNLKKNEETILSILKSLSEEETGLITKKNELLDMEETLKKRIIIEIETKKSKIIDLQTEIPKLKKRIEFLANTLEIPIIK